MSSQDSVIVLSEDGEEAEEYLKIHYHESKEFLDIPLESNGKVLSKDIIFMDSRISALIIQMYGSKRMVKLKEEYVKEPKEKWKNVKVYAVLKEDCEMKWNKVRSAKNSYPDVTDNWNTRTKSETPALLKEETQNTGITKSLPSSSNVQNKVKVEARSISRSVQHANHPIPSSTVTCKNDNLSQDESAMTDDDGSDSDDEKSSSVDNSKKAAFKEFCPGEEIAEPVNGNTVIDEPTNEELFLAYKVSSYKELEAKLWRGNTEYSITFVHCVRRFKRTMFAYPNNEFVRLIHWAKRSDIMMKQLDPNVNDVCVLCDEDFTLKHLVSQKHADTYHQKFNADPPEVAFILNPEIYEKYIDPSVLADLKIPEFKKMEERHEFLTIGKNYEFVLLRYILINRLLQGTLVMMKHFSFKKIAFLRKNSNHSSLQTIFKTKSFKCVRCNKNPGNNLHNYILHILTEKHLRTSLNQEEFNNICKAMSLVKNTPNGFCFESESVLETNRKRKQSSNNVQNGIKRQKNS